MLINVNIEKCNGCRLCEIVCSLEHERMVCPSRSRIEVIDIKESIWVPVFCYQCEDAPCISVCPVNALSRDPDKDLVVKDHTLCINCKACAFACPFGAMGVNSYGMTFKCDLCDGAPKCVEVCPMGALEFIEPEKVLFRKKIAIAEKLLSS
ncbi:MAG: 4Fe-4S dicluster domain-containing protein [Candidatus Helarchaeota archaeon]